MRSDPTLACPGVGANGGPDVVKIQSVLVPIGPSDCGTLNRTWIMADVAVGLLVPVLILDVTPGRDGQVFDIELGVATSSDEFFPFQIWGWSGTSRYSDDYDDERWDWWPAQYDDAHEIDIWEVDWTDGPVVGVHVHV